MKLKTILELPTCQVLNPGDTDRTLTKVFCCDLLSIAMGRAPRDGVWVTVMGNRNTLAVASLTEVACLVLAEGATFDESTLAQAKEEGIAVLTTELPVFDIALQIHQLLSS